MIYPFNHDDAVGEALYIGESRTESNWVISWGFLAKAGRYEIWSKTDGSGTPFPTEQEAKDEAYRIFAVARLTG